MVTRPRTAPAGAIVREYVPFGRLFPHAAAIVHHGGIGTTGLAMRAGRPMLVVPFAHDNPARAARLGIARTMSPARATADRLTAELRRLLNDPAYARRAEAIGEEVRQEDGTRTACDAIEVFLGGGPPAESLDRDPVSGSSEATKYETFGS